ncbi:hypothetical protein [Sulfurimicrobium lacus]|uniref:hypothetical protein n=1 Tax=Sulfurimicrobium lacus TaxID=2715678 RepID=UPI00156337A9|nr:hypothetical protein [Sulfurimicrobium lacus]
MIKLPLSTIAKLTLFKLRTTGIRLGFGWVHDATPGYLTSRDYWLLNYNNSVFLAMYHYGTARCDPTQVYRHNHQTIVPRFKQQCASIWHSFAIGQRLCNLFSHQLCVTIEQADIGAWRDFVNVATCRACQQKQ